MIAGTGARALRPKGEPAAQPYAIESVEAAAAAARAAEQAAREQAAYDRGIAEGERRGREAAVAPLERQNRLLAALGEAVRAQRALLPADAEEAVAALALEVARKVLGERSEVLREAVVLRARELVGRVRDGGPLAILVHPQDAPALEGLRDALAEAAGGAAVEVRGDVRVSPGGLLLETPSRLMDARIEVQLTRIGEALGRRQHG